MKTEEDLENFVDEYADRNISVGYELMGEQMNLDCFIDEVTTAYEDALAKKWIVL